MPEAEAEAPPSEGSGVVAFAKEQVLTSADAEVDYAEAKDVQTDDEGYEIVDKSLVEKVAKALSASEAACKDKLYPDDSSSSRGAEEDEPSVSGESVARKAQDLQNLVSKLVKALEKSESTIADLRDQLASEKKERKETREELEAKVDAANSKATEAAARAEDSEYALEAAETSLDQLKRVNRVLILENAIAVEQLKRNNVMGVEIPLLKLSESLSGNLSGEFKLKVTPLDPTSRQARMEASPRGKGMASTGMLTPELSTSSPLPQVTTPESQSKLLERNRRRMLLVDQSPLSPIAIDTSNTTEAVDALVADLMTRLNMVDLDINYKKLADFQYKIGDKIFHLKNINGRLFTRKGGGYQDLLMVLTSFLRF
ncbi:hypothetical protein HOP50_12g66180 [Chloropicon primus]|uniref:Uncharacterized protein n=1 Tax=Chloropicon primus TaxID=1764295 RepID=A0A5B8MUU0_9CHLO|nr:hypothetical protein A3770_12p65990 [Chloropicon primus]UPR03289.1 hypothetical protein HOP50_12g66180 [Chloropicon primus]|eukprot:QDZ24081.1 hypothetical protein A3770_12p65990 [Chloropicon primus]